MAIIKLLNAAQLAAIKHPAQFIALLSVKVPILYILANEVVRYQAQVLGLGGPH